MSLPSRFFRNFLAVGFCGLVFTSCLSTGVKKLGSNTSDGGGTATTDSDVFSVTIAYRNATSTDTTVKKTVTLQGVQGLGSASLVNICGALGTNCGCLFYRSATDSSPASSASVGISSQNNTLSCTMPAATTDPSIYSFVRLRNLSNSSQATGLLQIKVTVTLDDILTSSMSKQKVAGIYRYSCTRTFFEGEGVSAGNIDCVANQSLGVISADYNFYTYRAGDGTSVSGTGDVPFGSSICNRNSFIKIMCSNNTPVLEYGFYKDAVAPFLVGIQMTRGPEKAESDTVELVNNYGYAALPDSLGNCPVGLTKIRQWQAQPASIVQGSLGGNPPSSFINSNNNLNNTVVEAVQPANFVVNRQPNVTKCNASGDCTGATFGGTQVAESVAYTALTPVICVIPKEMLSGLF